MKSAHKTPLAVAAGFGVALLAAWAQTAALQSTFEVKKLPAVPPTGPPAFSLMEHGPSATAALTQAEHAVIVADLVKKLGVKLIAEQPFRISLSLTHPQAGFYARTCNARSYLNEPTWVSMWKPSPSAGPLDWYNASWVVAPHETKVGYTYTADFELRNFTGYVQGQIPFKVAICSYNPANTYLTPMYQGVLYSTGNNHLVIGYQAGFNGHVGVVIQPIGQANAIKGVNSVLITPHKVQ
jgi:hypothetical protein